MYNNLSVYHIVQDRLSHTSERAQIVLKGYAEWATPFYSVQRAAMKHPLQPNTYKKAQLTQGLRATAPSF